MLRTRRMPKKMKLKLKPLVVGYGETTKNALTALAIHYRTSLVQVITDIFTEFFNNEELKRFFKLHARDILVIEKDEESKTVSSQKYKTTFFLNEDLYELVSSEFWNYGFTERNSFVRCLIHFLHNSTLSPEKIKENNDLQKKLTDMGFDIKAGKVIMDGHWIQFGSPPLKDEKK